jgi:hypothetical protein
VFIGFVVRIIVVRVVVTSVDLSRFPKMSSTKLVEQLIQAHNAAGRADLASQLQVE